MCDMKRGSLLLVIMMMFMGHVAIGQSFTKKHLLKVIKEQLETKLPELINEKHKLEDLDVEAIEFKGSKVKMNGNFLVKVKGEKVFPEPILFKAKANTKLKKFGVKYLKVHKPGDKFLFFKRYRKII